MVLKMAMLAEQRRKKKISLDPRGSNWTNDDSKFGQKLLEKMGWSKGKGLGAKEDGRMEPVRAALRTDNRGVGCSKNHADNWIAHQDDFNALLANLSQDHGGGVGGGGNSSDEGTVKVSSLEQKSRTSRGRVHYQKFTKGKDLSLKSSNDLDCVFGKRKSQSGSNTPVNQSEANSDASDTEENTYGLKAVKSSDSVQSYFAKKMAEKRAKFNNDFAEDSGIAVDKDLTETTDNIEDAGFVLKKDEKNQEGKKNKKKSKKSKKMESKIIDNDDLAEFEAVKESIEDNELADKADKPIDEGFCNMENGEVEEVKKRKKKSKKSKMLAVNDEAGTCFNDEERIEDVNACRLAESNLPEKNESDLKKIKKSKKQNYKKDLETELPVDADNEQSQENGCLVQDSDEKVDNGEICKQEKLKKKSKKSIKKSLISDLVNTSANDNDIGPCDEDNNKQLDEAPKALDTCEETVKKDKSKKGLSKKRKIENICNDMLTVSANTLNEGIASGEAANEDNCGHGLSKKRKKANDSLVNFPSDKVFNGSNLSQIKGYKGLNEVVVRNGLKKKYGKTAQGDS